MFCAATGFAGTPKVGTGRFDASRLVPDSTQKRIRVHFNADRSDLLPWTFVPQQKYVDVLPGETSLAFYRAKNKGDKDVIGIATYNVTPDRVGRLSLYLRVWIDFNFDEQIAPYFSKVECFCFEEQKLLAGEEVDMPLLFFIDKDVIDDPACRNVDDVVLSYTFFRFVLHFVLLSHGFIRICSARRNAKGHLEPDADDEKVQQSMGFGEYEHAPKAEERTT
jgi:cytochrome c oxidase assembly protein subunit 11